MSNLKIYQLVDGVSTPFPNVDSQIEIFDYTYNAKRMGGAPTITASVMYPTCLDSVWTDDVYATFNGEKYFLKQTPTSSIVNTEIGYKHDLELVSERIALDNIYFYDVVATDEPVDRPVSDSANVVFNGDVREFAERLNYSLQYAKMQTIDANGEYVSGYHVVVDDDVLSVPELITFENQFFSNVLQEIYNTYEVPYYFDGKTIHIGFTNNAITHTFSYGVDNALLSITKTNANNKVVNRVSGHGSEDNIPYYYPNLSPKGETTPVFYDEQNGTASYDKVVITDVQEYCDNIETNETLEYGVFGEAQLTTESGGSKIILNGTSNNYIANTDVAYKWSDLLYAPISFTRNFKVVKDGSFEIVAKIHNEGYSINDKNSYARVVDGTYINTSSPSGSSTQAELPELPFGVYAKNANGEYTVNVTNKYSWINGDLVFFVNNLSKNASADGEYRLIINVGLASYAELMKHPDINNKPQNFADKNFIINAMFEVNPLNADKWYAEKQGVFYDLDEVGLKLANGVTPAIGNIIRQDVKNYIPQQDNLMPSIYRNSLAMERFFPAINYPIRKTSSRVANTFLGEYEKRDEDAVIRIHNDKYKDENGEYYVFEHPYIDGKGKEHMVEFTDVHPTIEGVVNAQGLPLGMFLEFAYDEDDNDEQEEIDGNLVYKHPYFFAKLRKFDGEYGFNLFDHAIEEDEMAISFTDGNCAACHFVIGVDKNTKLNPVQVYLEDAQNPVTGEIYKAGTLQRDKNGNVLCGREHYQSAVTAQDEQQDTTKSEVWIALKKDIDTFHVMMPNAKNNFKPKACSSADAKDGDPFVILNIKLPQAYVDAAEDLLDKELIHYLYENNSEKFTFDITFSRIFLAQNPDILSKLNENASIQLQYNGKLHELYVSSYSYKANGKDALPDISVELADTLMVSENALQEAVNQVETNLLGKIGAMDAYKTGLRYFLRKDVKDTAREQIKFEKGIELNNGKIDGSGNATLSNVSATQVITSQFTTPNFDPSVMGVGAGLTTEQTTGTTTFTVDELVVRQKMTVAQLIIQEVKSVGGILVVSKSNGVIESVTPYYNDDGDIISFHIKLKDGATFENGDLVRCSQWDANNNNLRSYWGKWYAYSNDATMGVLVRKEQDATFGIDAMPVAGDQLVLMGSASDTDRDGFIVISAEDGMENISIYSGVNVPTETAMANGLKTRLGNLENVVWNGKNLSGYGLMANTSYLNGEFVVSIDGQSHNLADVVTEFKVTSGLVSSLVTSNYTKGRNLLVQTNQGVVGWSFSTNQGAGQPTLMDYSAIPNGIGKGVLIEIDRGVATITPTWEVFMYQLRPQKIQQGKTYTITMDAKMDVGGFKPQLYICKANASSPLISSIVASDVALVANEWTKLKWQVTATESGVQNGGQVVYIMIPSGYIGQFSAAYFANLKLEEGMLETEWSYAPEDNDEAFANMQSEITQTANEINIKVDNLEDDLEATGINIQDKTIVATSDNFVIKNNTGQQTTTIDKDGQIAGGSFIVKTPSEDMSVSPIIASWNEQGKTAGMQRFYYPSGGVQLEIGYDGTTDSVFRFYNETGGLLWCIGGYAGFKGATSDKLWEQKQLYYCGETEDGVPTDIGSLVGNTYYQCTTTDMDGAIDVTTYEIQSEDPDKRLNGYYCPVTAAVAYTSDSIGGLVQPTRYTRTYYQYIDGKIARTKIKTWVVDPNAQ